MQAYTDTFDKEAHTTYTCTQKLWTNTVIPKSPGSTDISRLKSWGPTKCESMSTQMSGSDTAYLLLTSMAGPNRIVPVRHGLPILPVRMSEACYKLFWITANRSKFNISKVLCLPTYNHCLFIYFECNILLETFLVII